MPFRLILLVISACAIMEGCSGRESEDTYSGTISFHSVRVGSLVGGRVDGIEVEEGRSVKAGDVLIRLETTRVQSRLDEAEAGLEAARQHLKLLLAGTRSERVEAAKARAERLKKLYEVQERGARPEEIEAAAAELKAAKAVLQDAGSDFKRVSELYQRGAVSPKDYDSAQARLNEAEARVKNFDQRYKLLQRGLRPEEIEASRQSFLEAQARLKELESGPRPEEIESARAQVHAAEARVINAKTKMDELLIRSPADAVVQTLDLRKGDLLRAGSTAAVLLLPESSWITVYVPEDRLARVHLGQNAVIHVDGLKDALPGTVTFISTWAEFVPRNVQSREERTTQVFLVKITFDAPHPALKDGLWADVVLQ